MSFDGPGAAIALAEDLLIQGDCGVVLPRLPEAGFDVIYIDPPFNTGSLADALADADAAQRRRRPRNGFGGRRYTRDVVSALATATRSTISWRSRPEARARHGELLAEHGTLYFHIDYREAHYCKVLLDRIFGRECFLNEIIWAYDYGARTKKRWPAKHDTILVYVKDPERYLFNSDEVDREPYMAPGLVRRPRRPRGASPRPTCGGTRSCRRTGGSKTGYPTQKPEGIVRRMVAASSKPDGWCLDFFAGSGTLGAAAHGLGRRFVLVDENPEAIEVMRQRSNRCLAQSVAAEADDGAPGDGEHAAVADRGAQEQPAERLHDRRERLVLGEPAQAGRHRVGGDEPAAEERQQEQEHRQVARGLDALADHAERDRQPRQRERGHGAAGRAPRASRAAPAVGAKPDEQRDADHDGQAEHRLDEAPEDVARQHRGAGDGHRAEAGDDALGHVHGDRDRRALGAARPP